MASPLVQDPYNLLTPQAMMDPFPVYAKMRQEVPVRWVPMFNGWFITRYEDVKTLLNDKRTVSSNAINKVDDMLPPEARQQTRELRDFFSLWMVFMDPPDHTRLRRLSNPAFVPRVIKNLDERIYEVVDDLIDDLKGKAQADFIGDFAYPLPSIIIAEILGIPKLDRHLLKTWSHKIGLFFADQTPGFTPEIEMMHQTIEEMKTYMEGVIEEHRRNPQEDVLSALIAAEEDGDKLSTEELISTAIFFLFAGHDTSRNAIGNGLYSLLKHRQQYEKLVQDISLAPLASEEMLRFEGPQALVVRDAASEISIDGQTIQPGQKLFLFTASANRDPNQFENAHLMDITRDPNPHLAFGRGIHICLGMPLARKEIQVAVEQVVRRVSNMCLVDEAPNWRPSFTQRGLATLNIAFDKIL